MKDRRLSGSPCIFITAENRQYTALSLSLPFSLSLSVYIYIYIYMRFEKNSLIGVLLKLPFRDVFRETPLFLPGPFRDSVVLRYFILFMKKSVNKCRKKYDSNREGCEKKSQNEENPSGMSSRKPYFSFREPSGTAVFLHNQQTPVFVQEGGPANH